MTTIEVQVTDRNQRSSVEHLETGQSLMKALKVRGYEIQAICGGSRSCATCHVLVAPEWFERLEERSEEETELVAESDYFEPAASRLSCQIVLTPELDGLSVTLAPED